MHGWYQVGRAWRMRLRLIGAADFPTLQFSESVIQNPRTSHRMSL